MIDIAILNYKTGCVDIIRNVDLGDNPQLEDVDYYLSERYNMNGIYFMYATSGTININEMNNNFNKLY